MLCLFSEVREEFLLLRIFLQNCFSGKKFQLRFSKIRLVFKSRIFDTSWYLEKNPDVLASGENALVHFLRDGGREGRDPSPVFDSKWYLERYRDVKDSNDNPLVHYLKNGLIEGRKTKNATEVFLDLHNILEGAKDTSQSLPRINLDSLRFESNLSPLVSILLISDSPLTFTIAGLDTLKRLSLLSCCEILVILDKTGELYAETLEAVPGLRIVKDPESKKFWDKCNRASSYAKGEFLFIFESRLDVERNSLRSLLDFMNRSPDCGIVGSKVVDRSGILDSGGGIIWKEGTLQRFGRGDSPAKGSYCYLREIDFCPSLPLLIRSDLFKKIGGFSTGYESFEYASADLSLKAKESGWKTFYQPFSIVVSNFLLAMEESEKLASLQKDRQRFIDSWKTVLAQGHYSIGENAFLSRDRHGEGKTILVVDHYIPQHDKDAGSRTMDILLQEYVAKGLNVKFFPYDGLHDPLYSKRYQEMGIEIFYGIGENEKWSDCFEKLMKTAGHVFNYVFLSRPHIALEYYPLGRDRTSAKWIYYGHEIHFLRIREQMEVFPDDPSLKEECQYFERIEREIWEKMDIIFYPSPLETTLVKDFLENNGLPGKALTIPVYVSEKFEKNAWTNLGDRKGLIFVGGFAHPPNAHGVKWFVDEVFPLILEEVPDTSLTIIGSNPTKEVLSLGSDRITITGFITDDLLASYYKHARVAVAPLRYGGGVKGKVIESMKYGIPMVTTSAGVQGIIDAEGITVKDDTVGFAQGCIDLIKDDVLWKRKSESSVEYGEKKFSMETMKNALRDGLPGWDDERNSTDSFYP